MPDCTKWIEPALALFQSEVGYRVYHVYKNDDWNRGKLQYWYTTSPRFEDEETREFVFDVRDVANKLGIPESTGLDKIDWINEVIKTGLEAGHIKVPKPKEET